MQYGEQIDSETILEAEEWEGELNSNPKLKPLSPEKEKFLFEKIDLSGITDWEQEDQRQVRDYLGSMVSYLHWMILIWAYFSGQT